MQKLLPISVLILSLACSRIGKEQTITTASLLDEMTDLNRLSRLPIREYRTVQYSSYDRRSTKPSDSCWFANDDGFGNEIIPGFEKVLKQPNDSGTGEYLVCDIQQPGAIVRLWTAGISGKIRLYLDDMTSPVFEGEAKDFFWNTIEALSGRKVETASENPFRQFDATYFPIPFARGCRIEWIGNIKEIHFYHVGVRLYRNPVSIKTFKTKDISNYSQKLEETLAVFNNPDDKSSDKYPEIRNSDISISPGVKSELFSIKGPRAVEYFSAKIKADNIENVLRQCLLSIYFDNASVPQVQSPIGDFFGAAPGLNPYQSLPFSVETDGTMICRFVMPFYKSARFEIENNSGENIGISSSVHLKDYKWEDKKDMYFHARWKIDNDLTASNINETINNVSDITYLMAMGKGRIVGVSAFIYNPSSAVTSWGNWWGEGDEKIYVDRDTFPSFFGTGSEDYFNYSWSSREIFSYPYCGQPRNDGPGNRGYVSNFRWHILDDILFEDKIAFFMELGHHDVVPGFSYGRIVYFYAIPGLIDDYKKIKADDLREITYPLWIPKAYCGSAGYRFIQAENLIPQNTTFKLEKDNLSADGTILEWTPAKAGEQNKFQIISEETIAKTTIGLTLASCPEGGKFSVLVNGKHVQFDGKDTINLFQPNQQILGNHFSQSLPLNKGKNEILFVSGDNEKDKKIGIDFIWLKEK
jgi:hypothetical protein